MTAVTLLLLTASTARSVRGELIGYWNFDGNVDDQSGKGNDGELVDATYSDNVPAAIGKGQSVDFQTDTDHVFIENADGILDAEEFTLAMFVFDRGQAGAMERLTSRQGDTFETAINVHGPFNGMGEYSYFSSAGGGWKWGDEIPPLEQWQHVAYVVDATEQTMSIYVDGELTHTSAAPWVVLPTGFMHIGNRHNDVEGFDGLIDDVAIWDEVLAPDVIKSISQVGVTGFLNPGVRLQPGDADMDLDFDQLDLVRVQVAAKYLTGASATWGEGDWNGGPGGSPGNPPPGDRVFNQLDVIAALGSGQYLKGPYAAVRAGGQRNDAQTSVGYNPTTGELFVDAPAGTQLTSINIDSAAAVFTGAPAQNLGGSFDNDANGNIFKATFGSSFGTLSFGNVAQPGLTQQFVLNDLTVVGSLAGGGALGDVDLIFVPEPSAVMLALLGLLGVAIWRGR
jgi:hypothetical protein